MKPATRVNEFTLDIIEFCENDAHLYKELFKKDEFKIVSFRRRRYGDKRLHLCLFWTTFKQ